MNIYFSPTHSLKSTVLNYLSVKDVTHCRQTSKEWFQITNQLNWPQYVSKSVNVINCSVCTAMHRVSTCEHCPMCELSISEEHLVQCNRCNNVYCSVCIGSTCDCFG